MTGNIWAYTPAGHLQITLRIVIRDGDISVLIHVLLQDTGHSAIGCNPPVLEMGIGVAGVFEEVHEVAKFNASMKVAGVREQK